MKKAVIMCRVSSDEQAKGYSLDVQFESLTRHCAREGVEIIKHYKEDHSAKNFSRPEFKKFLEYAKSNKGKIDMLLITSWDRFSRNLTDSLIMLRKLKAMGIEVHAIEQPIDMSIPENKAMLAIFLALPEIDNERRSIKIRGGVRGALKSGRWSRVAPIGYMNTRDSENKPIIIPGEKAEKIKRLFELIKKGESQSDARGIMRREGMKISKSNISVMLRNPVYIGKIIVPELEDEPLTIIEGIHEGIIDERLFYEVQDIIEGRYKKRNRPLYNNTREELPLRGVLHCSKCDNKMTGSRSKSGGGNHHFYYHCNYCKMERMPAGKLNGLMEDIIGHLTFTSQAKELYEEVVKHLLSGSKAENKRKKVKIEKALVLTNERIEKIQDLFVDGEIDNQNYNATMERYSLKRKGLDEELGTLNTSDNGYRNWLKKGVNALSGLKTQYVKSGVSAKQELIRSIFPEKLSFDGEICRTERINDVLRFILQIDKDLPENKRGDFSNKLELSRLVAPAGIEPASKL